jgi:hypothetical protein
MSRHCVRRSAGDMPWPGPTTTKPPSWRSIAPRHGFRHCHARCRATAPLKSYVGTAVQIGGPVPTKDIAIIVNYLMVLDFMVTLFRG